MNPIEIEKDIRALEATGVRCNGNPALLPRTCSDARHKCRTCGKMITTYVPRGGDGSASLVRKHIDPSTGKICNGAYRLV